MAVRIRLRRTGGKNAPAYRVVVAEALTKRDGRFIENLGHYDPTKQPHQYKVDEERALYWLSVGAQPSETVRRLFSQAGIMRKFDEQKQARRKAAPAA